jgi:RNA polymerase sigma-70 factor (ECF subfamily)
MKVIKRKNGLVTEEELIEACKREERRAQKLLYDRYSPKMMGVCRRYVKTAEDAEDVLVEAFFKVLTNIRQFSGSGSFEGWIRRIVVNESLMFLRKRHNFNMTVEISNIDLNAPPKIMDELAAQDILELLSQLPTGYRTIFNLYVLEGYKHREIAEMLGISINTSKSQLILAKKRLQALLGQAGYPGAEEFAG